MTVDFSVLPTGIVDRGYGVKAELSYSEELQLSFSWTPALLTAMNVRISFCDDLKDGQGPFMRQGLREYIDLHYREVSEEVASTFTI